MTQTEKYIWLINTIYRAKSITLGDISRRWMDYAGICCDPEDHHKTFRPKFYRWKDEVYSQFGVIISCKRAGGYKYYIENPEVIEENKLNKWMLDTIATGNLISNNISVSDRILVNKIPSGNVHLKSVIRSLKNNIRIEITYRRFDRASHTFAINPYCLKLFENRWFVLALNNRGQIKLYCLDRILDIVFTDEHYEVPKDFNAEEYFAPYYGIIRDEKPERIVLRAYDLHRHYMASLPLHDSQRLIEDTGEYSDFELTVAPTYDFVMKLLSFGAMIEVIEPASLRDRMRGWITELHEMYKDK